MNSAQGESVTTIRAARFADSATLCGLSAQLGYPSSQEAFDARLSVLLSKPDEHVVLVAVDGDRLAGFAHVMYVPLLVIEASAQLAGLVVDAELRCRGIGERLMAGAEAWALSRGCRSLYLKSNVLRTRAHPFYERLGYVKEKTQYSFIKQLRDVSATAAV